MKTQTAETMTLPKAEIERLRMIERAARNMMLTKYGVGAFKLTTFDPITIYALREALKVAA
jgi:hypothetical protein